MTVKPTYVKFPQMPIDPTGLATDTNQELQLTQETAINTNLGDVKTKLDTVHTDLNTTIHGDIGSTNTKLDTLHADLNTTIHGDLNTTIHGDLTSTNSKLDTLHSDLGTLDAKDFSTSAKQDTGNSSLSSIDGKLTTLDAKDFSTSAKQDTGNTSLSSIDGKFTTLNAKDFATTAKQDTGNSSLSSIDGKFTTLNAKDFATSAKQDTGNSSLATIATNSAILGVVDQIDTTPLLDTASTNIPASASNPVAVVASLAAAVKKIISVEDIGEFIGLYTGAALSEVLYCVLPLGGGEINVNIPIATRISLRNMKNAAISSGTIALNFLG